MEKWERILDPSHVLVGLKAQRNFDAIREVASVLEEVGAASDQKRFLAGLIRREKEASTGIGKGMAVPHAHEDGIERQLLAIGISQQGVDFGALDGEPVRIIALLATPRKHQKQHMKLLASLSRLLQNRDVRESLVAAADSAEVVDIFMRNRKLS